MSVSVFAVTPPMYTTSPTRIERADVPSCARVIVQTFDAFTDTRTISAAACEGSVPMPATTAENGTVGTETPESGTTVIVSPDDAGDGATDTTPEARFACASNVISESPDLRHEDA
jgi:hypothetical protein